MLRVSEETLTGIAAQVDRRRREPARAVKP
jgi:hypothetical protein